MVDCVRVCGTVNVCVLMDLCWPRVFVCLCVALAACVFVSVWSFVNSRARVIVCSCGLFVVFCGYGACVCWLVVFVFVCV